VSERKAPPLRGVRIGVTRSREKAGQLLRLLEAQGAVAKAFPAIRTSPIRRPRGWTQVMRRLGDYRWIVFTSAVGAELFFRLLRRAGRRPADLAAARIAAIGPGTAAALRKSGREPDFVPSAFVAEALARGMPDLKNARILIPRAAKARSALPRGLARRGAKVTVLPIYRTLPDRRGLAAFRRAVLGGQIHAAVFASSSAAEFALKSLGRSGRAIFGKKVKVASIGPVTSRTLGRFGMRPAVQAKEYSFKGIAEAIVRYYKKPK
jgi:uroporphyrinogen III methyltransferase/synthase